MRSIVVHIFMFYGFIDIYTKKCIHNKSNFKGLLSNMPHKILNIYNSVSNTRTLQNNIFSLQRRAENYTHYSKIKIENSTNKSATKR